MAEALVFSARRRTMYKDVPKTESPGAKTMGVSRRRRAETNSKSTSRRNKGDTLKPRRVAVQEDLALQLGRHLEQE